MPLKKLFQNIHGFCSQPSAPFVLMVINPRHTPKHKLPYVELPGHRRLTGYGFRGWLPGLGTVSRHGNWNVSQSVFSTLAEPAASPVKSSRFPLRPFSAKWFKPERGGGRSPRWQFIKIRPSRAGLKWSDAQDKINRVVYLLLLSDFVSARLEVSLSLWSSAMPYSQLLVHEFGPIGEPRLV